MSILTLVRGKLKLMLVPKIYGPVLTIVLSLAYYGLVRIFPFTRNGTVFVSLVLLGGYFSGSIGAILAGLWIILFSAFLQNWQIDANLIQLSLGTGILTLVVWLIYNRPFVNGNADKFLRTIKIVGNMRRTLYDEEMHDSVKVKRLGADIYELGDVLGNLVTVFWGMAQVKREFEQIADTSKADVHDPKL